MALVKHRTTRSMIWQAHDQKFQKTGRELMKMSDKLEEKKINELMFM